MPDFSLSELLVVAVVALVCIKPEDMPAIMRKAGRITRNLRRQARDFLNELQLDDNAVPGTRWIQGDDGKMYEAYDIYSSQLKSCDEYIKIEAESPILRAEGSETKSWQASSSSNKSLQGNDNKGEK